MIDNLYGKIIEIEEYGNVFMFVSDISIAVQIPYIKEHLKGFKAHIIWMQNITLVWQFKHKDILLSSLSLLTELNEDVNDATWVHD